MVRVSFAAECDDMARKRKDQTAAKLVREPRAPRASIAGRRSRLIAIALALPETTIEDARHVGFSVRGRRFAWYLDNHHGDGRVALNCKSARGTNSALAEVHPERFHIPAYLGKQGWIGLWLDAREIDWDEVAELLRDAYRLTAPARLRATLGPELRTGTE